MTRTTLTLAIIAITSFCLSASKNKYKLGKVTVEELSNDSCPIDEDAGAYYIFDIGKGSIDFDNSRSGEWVVKFTRTFKIKVLNKEGLDQANFIIPIYNYGSGNREELISLKGRTYNLQAGKVEGTKLSSDNISSVEINKYLSQINYSMPQVKAGSIIEVEYTIQSGLIGQFHPWYFQHSIPVLHSEYDILIPDFMDYSSEISGLIPLKKEELSNHNQTFYIKYADYHLTSFSKHTIITAESTPAFTEEPYISSIQDNISRISFQLASVKHDNSVRYNFADSWESIDKAILEHSDFGGYLKDSKVFNSILTEMNITSNATDVIFDIHNKLKSKVQWNSYYSFSANENPSKVWKQGAANSAEINLMLVGLLRASGINAYPVLTSTRKHGYINKYRPSFSQFNHVIAQVIVDGKALNIDMTGNTAPGLLPYNSINFYGRVPGLPENNAWVILTPKQSFSSFTLISLNVDPENQELTGKYNAKLKDYAAVELRSQLSSDNYTDEYQELVGNIYPDIQLFNSQVQNFDLIYEDIKTSSDFKSNSAVQKIGDRYMIHLKLSNQIGENPFSGDERKYPIDLAYGHDIKSNLTINIPEGYKVESLPEAQSIALPDDKGSFQYSIVKHGNLIQINSVFLLKQRIFSSSDFDYLKQFYSLVMEKLNEPIIISKT